MSSSKNWFTQIPNSLIKTGKLDYRELALYTYYKSFAGENGYCNRTVANTSKDLHMEKKTVITVRDRLVVKGVITLEKVNQRVYRIFITNYWKINELDQKTYQVGVKSVIEEEPINIQEEYINTTENISENSAEHFVMNEVKEPTVVVKDVTTLNKYVAQGLEMLEKGIPLSVVKDKYFAYAQDIEKEWQNLTNLESRGTI